MKQKTNPLKPRYKMSLSPEQIDTLYKEDLAMMQRRLTHRMQDVRRRVLKATSFPMPLLIREQTGADEVRGYSSVCSKHHIENPGIDIETVVIFKNSRGICAYIDLDPFHMQDRMVRNQSGQNIIPMHRYLFTPHFFQRYEQRYGLDDGYTDIHNQFFFRNLTGKPGTSVLHTAMCKARPDDYKNIDIWSLCNDGLMLGQIMGSEQDFMEGKPYVMQMNTFLDIDTLTRRQDEYKNVLDSVAEYFSHTKLEETAEHLASRTIISYIKKRK